MTLKQQQRNALGHYEQWVKSDMRHIDEAYKKCSGRKQSAWLYCEKLCNRLGGTGLKVITHTHTIFTAGFEFPDPDTGVVMFMYITSSYDVKVESPSYIGGLEDEDGV